MNKMCLKKLAKQRLIKYYKKYSIRNFILSVKCKARIELKEIPLKKIHNFCPELFEDIQPYSNFIRCHRICIVNIHYIEKLNRNYNKHWLTIKGYN